MTNKLQAIAGWVLVVYGVAACIFILHIAYERMQQDWRLLGMLGILAVLIVAAFTYGLSDD